MKKLLLFSFIILSSFRLFAQDYIENEPEFIRYNYNSIYLLNQHKSKLYSDSNSEYFHTSIRPYRAIDLVNIIDPTIVKNEYKNLPLRSKFQRKLLHEDLIQYSSAKEEFDIRINPLMDFSLINDENIGLQSVSPDLSKTTGIVFSRGLQIMGQLGKRFTFYTELIENQVDLYGYEKDWSVNHNYVIPGKGIVDFLTKDQYDYLYATGYFQYKSKKFFTFEFGNGKNFIGDGYRSLLLSNNAANYPYFKITTEFGKVKYMNLFTKYLDVNPSDKDENHYSKWSANHYLTFNLGKKLSLGVFESTVWGNRENQRGYEISYLNPIIFYRSLEFLNGSEGVNVLLGGNAQYKIGKKSAIYSQFILDEFKIKEIFAGDGFWGNKYGFQFGVKSYDVFNVRNLHLLSEINYVRPFTYSHETSNNPNSGGLSNYGHLNQALAHPLGANFIEWVSTANYQYRRWIGSGELMIATKSFDNPGENFGGDIYQSNSFTNRPGVGSPLGQDYGYDMLIGNKVNIFHMAGRVGYIVNPTYNLIVEGGLTIRNFSPETPSPTLQERNDVIFSFGIKTDLFPKGNLF